MLNSFQQKLRNFELALLNQLADTYATIGIENNNDQECNDYWLFTNLLTTQFQVN